MKNEEQGAGRPGQAARGVASWGARLGKVLQGLALLAILGLVVIAALEVLRRPSYTSRVVAEKTESSQLRVDRFQDLGADGLLWARVFTGSGRETALTSGPSYGYGGGGPTANYIVYDPKAGASWRIFATDGSLVLAAIKAQPVDRAGAATGPPYGPERLGPVKALLFDVVDKDGNGDGRLSDADERSLMVADARGKRLRKLDVAYTSPMGHTVAGNELVVMVRTATGLGAVHISLETLDLLRFVKID